MAIYHYSLYIIQIAFYTLNYRTTNKSFQKSKFTGIISELTNINTVIEFNSKQGKYFYS